MCHFLIYINNRNICFYLFFYNGNALSNDLARLNHILRDFSFFFVIVLHNSAVSMCIRAVLYCRRLQNTPVAASKTAGHFCQFRTICLKQPCIALKEGCACGLAHCIRRSHTRGGCLTFENVLPLRAHVHNRDTAHSIGKRLSLPWGRRMLAN